MSLMNTAAFAVRTSRLGRATRWSPQRIERLASKRLRHLVRAAVDGSPFYRDRFRHVDLDRFELHQLPTTTKEELRAEFDRSVTDRRVNRAGVENFLADPRNLGRWYLDRYAVSHTSGSQGPPMFIVQDRRCLKILFSIMSARANAGVRPSVIEGLRRLRAPVRVAIVAQQRGFYPSAAAFEFMPELVGRFARVHWLSAAQEDLIEQLNEFQPNTLVGYASVLEGLALQANRLRLEHLRQLSNSSEQLTLRARARIEAAFGVPVLDHYGTGECLLLAEGCPTDGGAHINADWVILEVVDDDNRPVRDGELGKKVLITNLANTVQPFIRYEVGDRVALATEPCLCGSRLPRIERIEGRAAEIFWVRGSGGDHQILPGVLFHHAIDSLNEIREWQSVQHSAERIEVRLEPLPTARLDAATIRQQLTQRLYAAGLPNHVALDIHVVPSLTADRATGKFRRMVSLCARPRVALSRVDSVVSSRPR